MVAMSSAFGIDLDLESGLPQSGQKRMSAAISAPQKEQ